MPPSNLKEGLELLVAAIGAKIKGLVPPPLDTFVPGWSFFPFSQIEDVFDVGTVHAACSFGPEFPVVSSVVFDRSNAGAGDTSVPNPAGWSGGNWLVQRASQAPSPPGYGNNTARTEVTAFADLVDPSFGKIPGVQDLCKSSLRRNSFITISNLTPGNRYYYIAIFGTYPNSTSRATIIEPSDGGDDVTFGVDGVETILAKGLRRYGFTAAGTSISFLKSCYDASGSYQNGFVVTDQGTP